MFYKHIILPFPISCSVNNSSRTPYVFLLYHTCLRSVFKKNWTNAIRRSTLIHELSHILLDFQQWISLKICVKRSSGSGDSLFYMSCFKRASLAIAADVETPNSSFISSAVLSFASSVGISKYAANVSACHSESL